MKRHTDYYSLMCLAFMGFCKCRSVSKEISSMKWKFNRVQMDQIGGKKKMKVYCWEIFLQDIEGKSHWKKNARSGKLSGQAV